MVLHVRLHSQYIVCSLVIAGDDLPTDVVIYGHFQLPAEEEVPQMNKIKRPNNGFLPVLTMIVAAGTRRLSVHQVVYVEDGPEDGRCLD